jgi:hypothetical protein
MSVTLNESALRSLLEGEDSPVAELVKAEAERVARIAQQGIDRILERSRVRPQVRLSPQGDLSVIVGLEDEGSLARYLAVKETRERVWLAPALESVFAR